MVATRTHTSEEFASMPLDGHWELVDGELIELSPEGGRARWIGSGIGSRLEQFVSAGKLGWVFSAQTGFMGRACGPLSPPAITQSSPGFGLEGERSHSRRSSEPSRGSADVKRTFAGFRRSAGIRFDAQC